VVELVGRRAECEALDRLVADVLAGASRVLVLRGDAGVGKSVLLGYLSDRVAGWRVAAAFLTRATDLTSLPAARTRRALAAAAASVQAGAFDNARTLLTVARDGEADELQRAQIDLISAQMAFASKRGNEATLLLLAAAQRLLPLNLQFARQTYLDAFSAAQFAALLSGDVGIAEVARAVRSAPSSSARRSADATANTSTNVRVRWPIRRVAVAGKSGHSSAARSIRA